MSSKYFLLFSFRLVLYQSEISLLLKASCFILLGAGNFNPKCNLGNLKCNLGNPQVLVLHSKCFERLGGQCSALLLQPMKQEYQCPPETHHSLSAVSEAVL